MKLFLFRFIPISLSVLLLNGCICSGVIEESGNRRQISYHLLEYEDAYIDGDSLVLNGSAGRKDKAKKRYSAVFELDPKTGLPTKNPVVVKLRQKKKPVGSISVGLHYVSLPIENSMNPSDPKCYRLAIIETEEPSIYINTYTREDLEGGDRCFVNHYSALYVPSGTYQNRDCAVIVIPSVRSTRSTRALLLALPVALVADVLTLPVQVVFTNNIGD